MASPAPSATRHNLDPAGNLLEAETNMANAEQSEPRSREARAYGIISALRTVVIVMSHIDESSRHHIGIAHIFVSNN